MSVFVRLLPIALLFQPILLGQTIESVSPRSGAIGTKVSIQGSGLLCSGSQRRQPWFKGTSPADPPGYVEFSGISAEVLSWEESVVSVRVPSGARSGTVKVILPYCIGIIVLTASDRFRVLTESVSSADEKKPPPESDPSGNSYQLGFKAFLSGEFDRAIRLLESYLKEGGADPGNGHFYLGAAKSAKFFLGGEKDRSLFYEAQRQFQQARMYRPDLDPPRALISPKILEVFETAAPKPSTRP